MGRDLVYPKNRKTTIHRMPDRGTYNIREIHEIVNSAMVLHVSCNAQDPEDPFPVALPMIGTMASYKYPSADLSEPMDCYLHGYVSSGLMNQTRKEKSQGLPMTISATKVDGIVLSLTPNSHSYNYRSANLFGYGKLVEDPDEKVWAMRLITESVLPGRWGHTRTPPDGAEMASTVILRVNIVNGSGKIRTGGPSDDKKDTEQEELTKKTYTGVLPIFETVGPPVVGGAGRLSDEPEYIAEFRQQMCSTNEEYAQRSTTSQRT